MKYYFLLYSLFFFNVLVKAQVLLIDTSASATKGFSKPQSKDSGTILKDSSKILKANTLHSITVPDSVINRRNSLNKTNLTVLIAWAGANLVQGTISAGNLTGSAHYFHQMNAYFNIVNLAIGGIGLFELHKQMNKKMNLFQNLSQQQKIESILLLNSGLDLTYISTGLYLRERGSNQLNNRIKGYGGSLILQGSFLFAFDIIQYFQHRQNGKYLNKWIDKLQISTTQNGMGLVWPL